MHTETRGEKTYVYRTVRDGKHVRKIYVGNGPNARAEMALWDAARQKKALVQRQEAEEEAGLWALQQRQSIVIARARQQLEALYLAANYFKSKCRHWRPLSMDTESSKSAANEELLSVVEAGVPAPSRARQAQLQRNVRIKELCEQIKAGANHLRPELRRVLREEDPADIEKIGDLTRYAIDQWSRRISPENALMRESIAITAMQKRDELAPSGCTFVERVIADRLILAELQQSYHELRMTAIVDELDAAGGKIANAMEKRLSVATRELREATNHFQKAADLRAKVSPPRPQSGVAALKLYDPNPKRKSA